MITYRLLFTLLLLINLYVSTCHGGAAGFAAGLVSCNAGCQAAYWACIAAGGSVSSLITGGLALPGVVGACTVGEAACMAACVATFTVATGPI
ncbi:unnamed protein product [Rotaria sp. Silwood1]|nr:unnamed protein product [Rotaria sp. Silwood1]CAF4752688.1 unnamed protein product [Rotaria sp. Silwood1]CAF5127399.1 unnamed protein product [Rotaria sp. Silwood1]